MKSGSSRCTGGENPAEALGSAGPGPARGEPRQRRYSDFSEELGGAEVRVVLYNERVLSGRIVESRRYWVKLAADGSTYYYINKAWVVYVQPLKVRRNGEAQTGRR